MATYVQYLIAYTSRTLELTSFGLNEDNQMICWRKQKQLICCPSSPYLPRLHIKNICSIKFSQCCWRCTFWHFLAFFSSYVIWSQGVSVEWWGPGLDCSDGWRGGSVWPHNGTQDKSLLPLLDGMCCVRGGRDLQHFHIWPCHNVSQITLSLQIERGREREEVEG